MSRVVTHVMFSTLKSMAGMTAFLAPFCDALAALGVENHVISRVNGWSREDCALPEHPSVAVRLVDGTRPGSLAASVDRDFRDAIRDVCRDQAAEIVHAQGIWVPESHDAAVVARERGIPLVVSLTGMLMPWAFRHKGLKKQVAWRLYQARDLDRAAVLHATSEGEVEALRQLGLRAPIAMIPLAVEPPEWQEPDLRSEPFTMLYLSRVHRKKGLMHLVEAMEVLRPSDWRVVVVGGGEAGYQEELEAAIRKKNLGRQFSFEGFVEESEKAGYFRQADLFVLPTYSENFGLVVPEALAYGLPVVTTTGTPWSELPEWRCGWHVEVGTEPLVAALREAFSLSPEDRGAMGRRGRDLVEERSTFARVAKEMNIVYDWILGGGPQPDCVRTI